MRFSTSFIEFVRTNRFKPNSSGDRIFARVIEYRKQHNLDGKFVAKDPWKATDQTLGYEFLKLGIIFEAISSFNTCGEPGDIVEVLKETYPAAEVDELILEYFPNLSRQTTASENSAHP